MENGQAARIVVTCSIHRGQRFAARLTAAGFHPVLFPVIWAAPLPPRALDAALHRLPVYDWLIFTSVHAVDFFFQRGEALLVAGGELRIAAGDPLTAAALVEHGITPHFVPDTASNERLVDGLGNLSGQCMLLPRGRHSRPRAVELLRRAGVDVDDVILYDTIAARPTPAELATLAAGFEAVTFTNPSNVRSFYKIVGERSATLAGTLRSLVEAAAVACIGPITAREAAGFGLVSPLVPESHTLDGLVEVLVNHFHPQSRAG